jgi:hypothetical protein
LLKSYLLRCAFYCCSPTKAWTWTVSPFFLSKIFVARAPQVKERCRARYWSTLRQHGCRPSPVATLGDLLQHRVEFWQRCRLRRPVTEVPVPHRPVGNRPVRPCWEGSNGPIDGGNGRIWRCSGTRWPTKPPDWPTTLGRHPITRRHRYPLQHPGGEGDHIGRVDHGLDLLSVVTLPVA